MQYEKENSAVNPDSSIDNDPDGLPRRRGEGAEREMDQLRVERVFV